MPQLSYPPPPVIRITYMSASILFLIVFAFGFACGYGVRETRGTHKLRQLPDSELNLPQSSLSIWVQPYNPIRVRKKSALQNSSPKDRCLYVDRTSVADFKTRWMT